MSTLFSFKIRSRDRCTKQECKNNLLTVTGVAENSEKFYKVLAACDMCGKIYAFARINKRLVR